MAGKSKNSERGLMFPKSPKKKKRKTHRKSILYQPPGTCWLCICLHGDCREKFTHKHHIFGGPNRGISEAEGFTADLCLEHHELGREAVHNNYETRNLLQQAAQQEYEKTHSREEFMSLIGRNYL